jgi:hypothetical protein
VYLKLPARDFDRADRAAKQARVSIQDVLRAGLKKFLDERGNTF